MNTAFDFFSFFSLDTVICVIQTFMTERATSALFLKTCLKTMLGTLEKIRQKLLFVFVCLTEYFVVLCRNFRVAFFVFVCLVFFG